MNSLEYQLTIKSANQKVDDYSLTCRSGWTVARLKQHISETHVNKPNVGDQRLIYAGNLLKDSLTLKQVFFRDSLCTELTNSSKTDFTIHLVCSTSAQRSQSSTSSSPRVPANSNNGTSQAGQTRVQPAASASQATPSSRSPAGGSAPNNQSGTPGSNNSTRPPESTPSPGSHPSNSNYAIPTLASAALTNTHASEIAQRLLQTDQVRQQMDTFQQLANLVASELARNVSLSSSLAAAQSSGTTTTSTTNLTTDQTALHATQNTINSLLQGQGLNLQATTNAVAAAASPDAIAAATAAVTQINGNALAAQSIAAQILYANHPNRSGALPQNGHSLHGAENGVNGPQVVGHPHHNHHHHHHHQAQVAAAAPVAGPQVPQQAPAMAQAPIIDQPVPAQPIDPEPALQHDVIDWVYYSIRALIFMVALYIHASFFRLLFIVGLMALAYFFSRRSARRQNQAQPQAARQQPPQPAAAPAAAAAAPADHPGGPQDQALPANGNGEQNQNGELRQRRVTGANGQPAGEVNNNDANDNQADGSRRQDNAETGVDAAQRRVSFLKLCYLVVTDFLVSFVPE